MMKKGIVWAALPLVVACALNEASAEHAAQREQDVEFTSEGVTLAGTLWLPEGEGPHPAMVYVHGSGRVRRNAASRMASHFNQLGVAVMAYDKRGVGASEGDYEGRNNGSEQNLTLLGRDAAAGVAFLRGLPSIDGEQIGLWGVSQAGWIIPVASVLDGGIAFTILVSGPTVTVGEENYFSDLTGDSSAGRAGLSQEEISRLLAERGPFGFDPRPYLERLEAPGLWLLGSMDESMPIPETVAVLDDLIQTHDKPFTYRVWEGADHGLRVNGRTVPEFWQVQNDFLFDEAGIRPQR